MNPSLENESRISEARIEDFENRFFAHIRLLLDQGYLAMGKNDCWQKNEETISGDLREAIDSILDDPSESWMSCYQVENEKPVQQHWRPKAERTREGKSRQKIDLELSTAEKIPRRRFSIEAKLLRDSHSISAYVGDSGIGCFVNGEYARDENAAGMAGYIQTRTLQDWTSGIEEKMEEKRKEIRLVSSPAWGQTSHQVASASVMASEHGRIDSLRNIDLLHFFLDFRKQAGSDQKREEAASQPC